jgi:UDP-N-acetylmuramoyl-tripeptide--D-alanyl-D-alanine ligase
MGISRLLANIRFSRYNLIEALALLRSRTGRKEFGFVLLHYSLPVTSRVARLYRRLFLRKTHVVAVVGSLGKTTTTRAVMAALGGGPDPKVEWNAGATVPLCLFAIRPSQKTGVLEVGINGPGQMTPIMRIAQPDLVVVTSIASEHNRAFQSLEATREEKANAVRCLPPNGVAVLNRDDPNVFWMAGHTRARVVTFGFGEGSHVRASDARIVWPGGTRFRLHVAGEEREVTVRLLGRHMVRAALAAVAVALEEGHRLDDILPRLAELRPTPGRLALRPLPNGAMLLADDFKGAVESIHAALDVLEEIPAERKIVVMGPIAEPTGAKLAQHREVGRRIGRVAQLAVTVGGYKEYKSGLRQGGLPAECVHDAGSSYAKAVEILKPELRPGDVVLVKGRGDQSLERIGLALEGRAVRCALIKCQLHMTRCESCSMLEAGA